MLLILMFHKVTEPEGSVDQFESYLRYVRDNFNIVLPGDKLSLFKQSICLTFDDAYADFYFKVYPLLVKYQIPAVVAVPTKFILESTEYSPSQRMAIKQKDAMKGDCYLKAPFCTWQELKEMSQSPLVKIASHHHSHLSVNDTHFSVEQEMVLSKNLLEQYLSSHIDTLIYPYGHYNDQSHQSAKELYRYIMRISYACNFSWNNKKQLLYRVNADPYWKNNSKFSIKDRLKWLLKFISNKIRDK